MTEGHSRAPRGNACPPTLCVASPAVALAKVTRRGASRRQAFPRRSVGTRTQTRHKENRMPRRPLALLLFLACPLVATAQAPRDVDALQQRIANLEQSLNFLQQSVLRKADEEAIFRRLEDVALVTIVRYTGPPPRVIKNPTAPGAKNPVIIPAYTFLPKKHLTGPKLPLLVYVHGGVHGHLR